MTHGRPATRSSAAAPEVPAETPRWMRAWRRLLWTVLGVLPERYLTRDTAHGRLMFSSHDRIIGARLFVHRNFDHAMIAKALRLAIARRHVPERDRGLVLDIGANLGSVCIPLVKQGGFPTALAFEPETKNFELLVRNIALNGLAPRITALNVGLSSESTTMALELSPHNFGDHRIRTCRSSPGDERYGESRRRTITIAVRRLDDVLEERGVSPAAVGLTWMDVQGHEARVLAGASHVLGAGAPLVTEFWPYGLLRSGTPPAAFVELLEQFFATAYDLSEPEPRPIRVAALREIIVHYERARGRDAFIDVLLARAP